MVKIYQIFIFTFIVIFCGSCASKSLSIQDEILKQYNKGIEYYNEEKYSKAKEAFQYVVLHSTGSRLALESEFYLAESLYNMEDYFEALYSYDNYARSSPNIKLIELSRYKICKCSYELSTDYKKDQSTTTDALNKIEIFLEDYPESEYYESVSKLSQDLRYKLAVKDYESAKLYMKLGEYTSALIYLLDVLNNYSELNVADDVRITIIFAYILDDNYNLALEFYNRENGNFKNIKKQQEAKELIVSSEQGVKITEYLRLFK